MKNSWGKTVGKHEAKDDPHTKLLWVKLLVNIREESICMKNSFGATLVASMLQEKMCIKNSRGKPGVKRRQGKICKQKSLCETSDKHEVGEELHRDPMAHAHGPWDQTGGKQEAGEDLHEELQG